MRIALGLRFKPSEAGHLSPMRLVKYLSPDERTQRKERRMNWRKPSEPFLELLEESLGDIPFEPMKLFGQFDLFLNGNMFTGVFEDSVFLRYTPDGQEAICSEFDEVSRFEPKEGRAMGQ
jgi:hypothetical protein